jgi:hypothetical protein
MLKQFREYVSRHYKELSNDPSLLDDRIIKRAVIVSFIADKYNLSADEKMVLSVKGLMNEFGRGAIGGRGRPEG